ncbi:MAG TPA: ascorbate-dependent monooxygenase [Thermoanaerobaculia bacterium]|nr:ascorbate-dependent monooxygenase [Thermoanaerobaculia bacterium]
MNGIRPPRGALLSVVPALFAFWTMALTKDAQIVRPPPRVVAHRPVIGETPVTFSNQVVRILQAHCQTCHRTGGIAPFSLVSYGDAFANREKIVEQTGARTMPPWHVDNSCASFDGDPSLTDQEISTLSRWVSEGAPQGDPHDLPPPRSFPDDWELGPPDQVLTMAEPMTPDFGSGDVYRCFVLPTGLTADKFVSTVEVIPGSRRMVHHVILFIDSSGSAARQLDAQDPGPGYTCFGAPGFAVSPASTTLGGWAPGNSPRRLPDGVGMSLPAGSDVVMQVHYSSRSGVREADTSSVGLYFTRGTVRKRLIVVPLINQSFTIPAGAPDHEVTASIPFFPFAAHVLAITPHMHLLGRQMTVTLTRPDQSTQCLVRVPDWDFHWQATYFYRTPVAVPFGSRFDLSARYDNSVANPENPNSPPRDVGWGENTTDEMCIAFLGITLDEENLASDGPPER